MGQEYIHTCSTCQEGVPVDGRLCTQCGAVVVPEYTGVTQRLVSEEPNNPQPWRRAPLPWTDSVTMLGFLLAFLSPLAVGHLIVSVLQWFLLTSMVVIGTGVLYGGLVWVHTYGQRWMVYMGVHLVLSVIMAIMGWMLGWGLYGLLFWLVGFP